MHSNPAPSVPRRCDRCTPTQHRLFYGGATPKQIKGCTSIQHRLFYGGATDALQPSTVCSTAVRPPSKSKDALQPSTVCSTAVQPKDALQPSTVCSTAVRPKDAPQPSTACSTAARPPILVCLGHTPAGLTSRSNRLQCTLRPFAVTDDDDPCCFPPSLQYILTSSEFCFTIYSPGDLAHSAKGHVKGLLYGKSPRMHL